MSTLWQTNPDSEHDGQRLIELRRHREIVYRWASIRSLPTILQQELQIMLGDLERELNDLEARLRQ